MLLLAPSALYEYFGLIDVVVRLCYFRPPSYRTSAFDATNYPKQPQRLKTANTFIKAPLVQTLALRPGGLQPFPSRLRSWTRNTFPRKQSTLGLPPDVVRRAPIQTCRHTQHLQAVMPLLTVLLIRHTRGSHCLRRALAAHKATRSARITVYTRRSLTNTNLSLPSSPHTATARLPPQTQAPMRIMPSIRIRSIRPRRGLHLRVEMRRRQTVCAKRAIHAAFEK